MKIEVRRVRQEDREKGRNPVHGASELFLPSSAVDLQNILTHNGFRFEVSDFFVMTVDS